MVRPHLRTFLTVCDTGSFNRAAASLYITPSAVIQQIQTLEAELNVTLFNRTTKGVSLTPEGQFLREKGSAMLEIDSEIHRDILAAGSEERTICIGTSLMEKCRLLYDLWVLFSAEEKNCEIRMLNIDVWHKVPERTDMIESINANIEWERAWKFYEICKIPIGFAVPRSHPLSRLQMIRTEDLREKTVLVLDDESCDTLRDAVKHLRSAQVNVVRHEGSESSLLWGSGFQKDLIMIPICWKDVLTNVKVIPYEEEFFLPYGIFYRPEQRKAARRFLDFIIRTYETGNSSGMIPVLEI